MPSLKSFQNELNFLVYSVCLCLEMVFEKISIFFKNFFFKKIDDF